MDLVVGALLFSSGLGIVLSFAAGHIWREKGGALWVGVALSVLLGLAGFLIVIYGSPRRAS